MTTIRRVVSAALVCASAFASAAVAQDRVLTIQDVSPALANLIGNTELDYVAEAEIKYGVTGKTSYDDFFKSSAICYGGLVIGQGMVENATKTLKKYAHDKTAIAELQEQIAAITEGADPSTWSIELSLAVLRIAEEKDQLSNEEREYLVKTVANAAATLPVVRASVASARDLIDQASGLISGARSEFGMRKAGGVVRNVRRSVDRVSNVPTEGAHLVESLTVLVSGIRMTISA